MNKRVAGSVAVVLMMASVAGWGADAKPIGKVTKEASATATGKVSVKANDQSVTEILESLAKQSGERFVIESTVTGKLSLTLTDSSLEAALGCVSKMSGKLEWRKVYVDADSDLVRQPDRFASTVRLLAGLGFPNLIVAGSSKERVSAHFDDKKGVVAAEESAAKKLGMVKVYLITNDTAVAAKAAADSKKESKEAVNKYVKGQQDQIDAFMKMTPEEREQALVESLNVMDKVGPEYMGAALEALSKADPAAIRERVAKQSEMMLSMSPESRRAMMRMSIQAQQMVSPEVQRVLAEDAKAVMEELQAQQSPQP